ncbi:MAG: selenide, water dikinase SelD, partial [Pseudomonadota bacterium]
LTEQLGKAAARGLLAGLAPFDDAAVVPLSAESALVTSVDFFPPLVDEPRDYGRIAAANALSDIYAMGGEPAYALAISGFPGCVAAADILAVNQGATEVLADCGAHIIGGHSIRCQEPVFGLSVFGFVHPDQVWRKAGAVPGDVLVLSKPVGTGVLLSEHAPAGVASATASMVRTNKEAAEALRVLAVGPSAVTDITGFGLIGHAHEMAVQSGVSLVIDAARIPTLPGALTAAAHHGTSADATLRHRYAPALPAGLDPALQQLLFDPQTSGGLLAAVAENMLAPVLDIGFTVLGHVEVATQHPVSVVIG